MPNETNRKRTTKPKQSETGLSQAQAEQVVKKTRGGKTISVEYNNTATQSEMKSYIGSVLYWQGRTKVASDQECAERLNEFFQRIGETGEMPSVEKMCLALGTNRMQVWRWEHGEQCSPERTHMIQQAKQMLAALDAELVQHNKIPQVTYIFRAKNFYGYKDQTDVVVTPSNPLGEQASPEQLEEYLNVIDAD